VRAGTAARPKTWNFAKVLNNSKFPQLTSNAPVIKKGFLAFLNVETARVVEQLETTDFDSNWLGMPLDMRFPSSIQAIYVVQLNVSPT
jgi:hypothetical protein